ncbi:hypothetical protein [Mobilicoccus pelagius]|nr:hypothetical protein [Mobilicoccus pelagius]
MPSTAPTPESRPVDPTEETVGATERPASAEADASFRPAHAARMPRRHVVSVDWVAFIGTGVVLGFVLGGLAHLFGPAAQVGGMAYGFRTSLLFLATFGAMIGAMLGALTGVIADAALQRRARR